MTASPTDFSLWRDMWWAAAKITHPRPIDSRALFMFSMPHMSAILQINRDFPFQVALTFDEAAMDVLDWLEGQSLEWDMYVDLPGNSIRYCFRSMVDAMAFKRRFSDAAEGRVVASGH